MSTPFFRIQKLPSTASTNTIAIEAAERGEAEGLVVCADRQTGGRGRHGRVWESPEGNLYASVLLRPNCTLQEACGYSFGAAMAVFDAITRLRGDAALQLKWPNDVLIDGRKISGLLLETAPLEDGLIKWLVIGVGINVAACPQGGAYPATCLAQEGGA